MTADLTRRAAIGAIVAAPAVLAAPQSAAAPTDQHPDADIFALGEQVKFAWDGLDEACRILSRAQERFYALRGAGRAERRARRRLTAKFVEDGVPICRDHREIRQWNAEDAEADALAHETAGMPEAEALEEKAGERVAVAVEALLATRAKTFAGLRVKLNLPEGAAQSDSHVLASLRADLQIEGQRERR